MKPVTTIDPIAVGGIGGSGTRVIAGFLRDMGVYIGSALNGPNDNLWYPVLFGRRDVFLDTEETDHLIALFLRQMSDPAPLDAADIALIRRLAHQTRVQHSVDDLRNWAASFIQHADTGTPQPNWGWKVPYTHVLIDRLFIAEPRLRYIHISRDGRDMAFSGNQNQLMTWGPLFLNRNVTQTPADSLAYWVAVHKRMARLTKRFPDRVFHLDFDQLIRDPRGVLAQMFAFLNIQPSDEQFDAFCQQIRVPDTAGRAKDVDTSVFYPDDLAYVQGLSCDPC